MDMTYRHIEYAAVPCPRVAGNDTVSLVPPFMCHFP